MLRKFVKELKLELFAFHFLKAAIASRLDKIT